MNPRILMAAALLAVSPAAAQTSTSSATVTGMPLPREAVTRLEANLREGPGIQSPILAQLPGGSPVTVIAEDGLWRQVRSGEVRGWVHAALLR